MSPVVKRIKDALKTRYQHNYTVNLTKIHVRFVSLDKYSITILKESGLRLRDIHDTLQSLGFFTSKGDDYSFTNGRSTIKIKCENK